LNTTLPSNTYDYIIAGSGCAGLTLLYRILLEPALCNKKILVIDKERKDSNDRTWCFWEKDDGLFQPIVHHQWDNLDFFSEYYSNTLHIAPYRYKMIKGLDFYNHVYAFAAQFKNVEFRYDHIKKLYMAGSTPVVQTKSSLFSAGYIFNSTKFFSPETIKGNNSLLMHFKGWTIKTDQPCLDPGKGTLMDFNVDQQGGTAFMYLLPTTNNEALVEYTLFTGHTLSPGTYTEVLKEYIHNTLKVDTFELLQEESGVIPLTKKQYPTHHRKKIIHIGTAGGCVKASSGYAFQFIQQQTDSIILKLKEGKTPIVKCSFKNKKFLWYDRTFLDVLIAKKMSGAAFMSLIIEKITPEKVLDFLGNESNIIDDFNIMKSVPIRVFLPTAIRQIF